MSVRLINPLPLSVSSPLSACLTLSHTLTSPSLSLLSFWAGTFETKESILILSYELLNIHLPIVLSQDIHTIGSLSNEVRGAVSRRQTCYATYVMTGSKVPLGCQLSS